MIDWSHVEAMRKDMGDSFDEIVDVFLDEAGEVIRRLEIGGSGPALGADLHFLKGAALNLGFTDFAGHCATGEIMVAQGRANLVDVGSVVSSFHASNRAFLGRLRRHAA